MRILLAGESNPGHLAPLIAVYEELKSKTDILDPQHPSDFMLVSTDSEFVETFVSASGVRYQSMGVRANYEERGMWASFVLLCKALRIVFSYMPDVIFVKSGYVSLPVVWAAWLFRIPVVAHEANLTPDRASLSISKRARRVAVAFKKTGEFLGQNKTFLSGNPVNKHLLGFKVEEARAKFQIDGSRPVIFIMAGAKGAAAINHLVLSILPELLQKYEIIHQSGIEDYEKVKAQVQQINVPALDKYHLFPFMKQHLGLAYTAADLLVGRAGANTVAEIIMLGKPSILIPLNGSHGDNQTQNAYYYSRAGAAVMLNEGNLKPSLFMNAIREIMDNKNKQMEMMRAARSLANPHAADLIADEIITIAK